MECHHRLNSILLIKRVKKQKPNKISGEKPAQPSSSTVRSSCELKTDKDYQNDRPFSNDKIALLRSKTTPLNSSKFLKLESDYNDCKAQMQVITSLVTLKLKDNLELKAIWKSFKISQKV